MYTPLICVLCSLCVPCVFVCVNVFDEFVFHDSFDVFHPWLGEQTELALLLIRLQSVKLVYSSFFLPKRLLSLCVYADEHNSLSFFCCCAPSFLPLCIIMLFFSVPFYGLISVRAYHTVSGCVLWILMISLKWLIVKGFTQIGNNSIEVTAAEAIARPLQRIRFSAEGENTSA